MVSSLSRQPRNKEKGALISASKTRRRPGSCQQALGARSYYVDHGGIVCDLSQDLCYRLNLVQAVRIDQLLHALQFLIEGKFLVVIVVAQPPAELQSRGQILKHSRDLLHRSTGRIVEADLAILRSIFIGQSLLTRRSYPVLAGIGLLPEIFGARDKIEDFGSRRSRQIEIKLK